MTEVMVFFGKVVVFTGMVTTLCFAGIYLLAS